MVQRPERPPQAESELLTLQPDIQMTKGQNLKPITISFSLMSHDFFFKLSVPFNVLYLCISLFLVVACCFFMFYGFTSLQRKIPF